MKHIYRTLIILAALCSTVSAQPTPVPGLQQVAHDSSLTGNGKVATPLGVRTAVGGGLTTGGGTTGVGLITSCSANQVLQWNGAAWACATVTGGGGGGITNSAGANVIMKSDGTNAIASGLVDNTTQISTTEGLTYGNVNAQNLVGGPTLQNFAVPNTAYAYGEINRIEINGVVPAFPADLAGLVIRMTASADTTSHTQRQIGLAAEAYGTRSAGANTMYNIAIECLASGAQVNNCFEALQGDVEIDAGNLDLYGASNYIFEQGASGFIAAAGVIFAESAGTNGIEITSTPTNSIRIRSATGQIDMQNAGTANLNVYNSNSGLVTMSVQGPLSGTSVLTGGLSGAKWSTGAGVPAIACAIGDLFSRNNGAAGTVLYTCTAINTWTAVGSGGGGGITNSAGNNVIMKSDGTNAIASLWTDDGTNTKYNTTKFTLATSTGNGAFLGTLTADGGLRVIDTVSTGLAQSGNSASLSINGGSSQSCSAGSHFFSMTTTGIVTCTADSGGGGSVTGSGTTGNVPIWTSSTALGDSGISYSSPNFTYLAGTSGTHTFSNAGGTLVTISSIGKLTTTQDLQAGGTLTVATYASVGTQLYLGTGNGKLVLDQSNVSITCDENTNATANCIFNPYGYAGSTTQARGVIFYDGKGSTSGHEILKLDGTNDNVSISNGSLSVKTTSALQGVVTAGLGADSTSTIGSLIYATNAGTTTISARDSTNHVESYITSSSSGGFEGTVTNHSWHIQTNGTNAIQIDTSQNSKFLGDIQANIHIVGTGSAPSPSSCGGSPSISGTDIGGQITVGSATTTCTVTFAVTASHTACVLTGDDSTSGGYYFTAQSASAFTFTKFTTGFAGDHVNYHCDRW